MGGETGQVTRMRKGRHHCRAEQPAVVLNLHVLPACQSLVFRCIHPLEVSLAALVVMEACPHVSPPPMVEVAPWHFRAPGSGERSRALPLAPCKTAIEPVISQPHFTETYNEDKNNNSEMTMIIIHTPIMGSLSVSRE